MEKREKIYKICDERLNKINQEIQDILDTLDKYYEYDTNENRIPHMKKALENIDSAGALLINAQIELKEN